MTQARDVKHPRPQSPTIRLALTTREAEMKERQRQADKSMQELKQQYKELGIFLDKVGTQLDGLGFNVGCSAEEYIYRSFVAKPELGGIKFDTVYQNIRQDDHSSELDIVLRNGRTVVVIEVKHRLHPDLLENLS